MTIGRYITSGFSNLNLPLSAGMTTTTDWRNDMVIGKIAIRIPYESSFPLNGEIIDIVYDNNTPPSEATMIKLGEFETRTSAMIENLGEWQPLTYTSAMYIDQFEYFTTPNNIYAYSDGHSQFVIGDPLSTTSGYITAWPTPVSDYDWLGSFDIRLFYDQISYNKIDDEIISIDSSTDDQSSPLTRVIAGDGCVEFRWESDSYTDQYGIESTVYNVSGDLEYYGDNNNRIKFPVSNGDTVYIYVTSSDAASNVGTMNIKYTKENF